LRGYRSRCLEKDTDGDETEEASGWTDSGLIPLSQEELPGKIANLGVRRIRKASLSTDSGSGPFSSGKRTVFTSRRESSSKKIDTMFRSVPRIFVPEVLFINYLEILFLLRIAELW
jgi:hypothetical protein